MGTINEKVEAAIAALEKELGPTAGAEMRRWYALAMQIVKDLAKANTNLAFHEWWAKAVEALKAAGMQNAETIGPVLVHVVWDQVKQGRGNPVLRFFKRIGSFFAGIGLDEFLKLRAKPLIDWAVQEALPALSTAQSNADLLVLRNKLFLLLRAEYVSLSKTYLGVIVQAALAIASKKALRA